MPLVGLIGGRGGLGVFDSSLDEIVKMEASKASGCSDVEAFTGGGFEFLSSSSFMILSGVMCAQTQAPSLSFACQNWKNRSVQRIKTPLDSE